MDLTMKKAQISILLVALLAGFLASSLSAKSYTELQKLVDSKSYVAAFELAQSLSETENGEPEFDLLYGIAAREADHADIAVFAFERILMQNQKNARVQYEMALALLKVSDFRGAKTALNMVFASRPSASLRENSQRLLDLAEKGLKRKSKPLLVLSGSFDVGYNSNVNSSSSEILSTPPGPRVEDGFAQLRASAFVEKRLNKKDALYFVFSSLNRKNFSSPTYDFNTINLNAGFHTQFGIIQFDLPYFFDVSISNYRPVIFSNALGVELATQLADMHQISLITLLKSNIYTSTNNNHLLTEITGTYKGRFLNNSLRLETGLFYRPVLSGGELGVFGSSIKETWGLFGKAKYNFTREHQVFAKVKYRNSDFWMTPLDLSVRRNDSNFAADVGYSWQLSQNFSAGPTYSFVRNSSNKPANTYTRHQAQLGLKANF